MAGFKDIIGQDQLKEYFVKALQKKQFSHAYILTGETGMGRKTLAEAFAMSLLCESDQPEPCEKCHSCIQFMTGNHPDMVYVKHSKPNSIGVDDVREQVINDVGIRPYNNGYKVYLIDEAEKLTVQAQNALLKTIEEPPSYAVILLITNNADAFLPTILSRCVVLKLKPLYDQVIEEYLTKNLMVDQKQAKIYTAFARGNLGRAISLASSDSFMNMEETITRFLKALPEMSIVEMLEKLKMMRDDNMNMDDCLDFMSLWYRDVLLFKATQDMNLIIFKDEYRYIKEISDKSSFPGLDTVIQAIDKAKTRLHANVNFELTMELMLLTIKEN